MGLDVVFGAIILVAAFRGWFKGFVGQTVRLTSLVASVYLADRVRDYAKPYVVPCLSTIQPDLIDRLLWWVSAVATYVVLVGVATLIVKMGRRPEIPGISQKSRNDQFAGFMLGSMKGVIIAAFLAHGIQTYGMAPAPSENSADDPIKAAEGDANQALRLLKGAGWADEQIKASWAMRWSVAYRPVPKIWSSRPVRHFVNHIERMGIRKPNDQAESDEDADAEGEPPLRTASKPPSRGASGQARTERESSSGDPAPSVRSTGSEPLDVEAEKAERPKKARSESAKVEGSN